MCVTIASLKVRQFACIDLRNRISSDTPQTSIITKISNDTLEFLKNELVVIFLSYNEDRLIFDEIAILLGWFIAELFLLSLHSTIPTSFIF